MKTLRQIEALEYNHTIFQNEDGTITITMNGPKEPDYVCVPAYTLSPSEVCEGDGKDDDTIYSRTHADGWTISGCIHEDYYYWVNEFSATKTDGSFVKGDFESEIHASSIEAVEDFIAHHTPSYWDYWDI